MFLVTTADQRFWKKDEKILFLGEWCKIYSQKNVWSRLDHQVLPYHWDDRARLYQDYLCLDAVYERYLIALAHKLNDLHSVNHSIRYWRIIVGPWLFFFIGILYDRYLSIRAAVESGLVTGTWIIPESAEKWIPKDVKIFQTWFISDAYNQYLYSRIIETLQRLPFEFINVETPSPYDKTYKITQILHPKYIARKFIEIYARNLPSQMNRIALIESYFSIWDLIKLQISLGQLPYPLASKVEPEDIPVKQSMRKNLILKQGRDDFESILDWFIAKQIPKAYVEAYADMHQRSLEAFPEKPKVIVTANPYNEGFNFWTAYHVECKAKLVGAQHGGGYGSLLWIDSESHEIKIYDRYYTWGWQRVKEPKIASMSGGKLNKIQRTIKPNPKGSILCVVVSLPRYFYRMGSHPVGPQILYYIKEQSRFAQSVSSEVHELLLLRLYQNDYGWNEKNRWSDTDTTLKIYQGRKTMYQQLNESRLFLGTYNGTTILETLSANFPTVLFWNPNYWELRPSAQPYFDKLRQVGILHDSPESAAAKVNEIYKDVDTWWRQPEIQKAKDEFCKQFAFTSKNWLKEWRTELLNLANS